MQNEHDREPGDIKMNQEKVEPGRDEANSDFLHDIQATESVATTNIFSQGGQNYRTLNRKDTILILFTNQIGLGVLSLPSVMQVLGLVPGIIAIVGLGLLTWYSAYLLLEFYKRHPHVVNIVDMTRVVGGRWFEEVVSILFIVQMIFYTASPTVTLSIVLNAISDHATCTVVFIFVATAFCYLLSVPRTFKFVSFMGIPNAISVLCATGVVLISLAIAGPARAPEGWERNIRAFGDPSFGDALNACLRIMYSYAANVVFVSFFAEMIDPIRDFNFCLTILELGSIFLYTAVAVVFYCILGDYTTSPILGAAFTVPAKVAYGLIIPAVVATSVSNGHTGCKYVYVLAMKKMGAVHQITDNSVKSWATWIASVTGFWVIVFVLSNAIPIFNSIVSIATATTVPWFTYGFASMFWLHSNWDNLWSGWKKRGLTLFNFFLIIMSVFFNVAGLWSSITELLDIFNSEESAIRGAFSCGNNAAQV